MAWKKTLRYLLIPMAAAAILTGCGSGGGVSQDEMAAVPPPAPTPAPAMAEQTVSEPSTATVPSVEAKEELPADLQELNRRGYLRDVFFDTDRYDLKPEARDALAADAAWLQDYPSVQILVEGHCDERNTREYNLALGERRANAARDYLLNLGVPASRVQTISYGEERPFALGHSEAAWLLNRRAHFVIVAR